MQIVRHAFTLRSIQKGNWYVIVIWCFFYNIYELCDKHCCKRLTRLWLNCWRLYNGCIDIRFNDLIALRCAYITIKISHREYYKANGSRLRNGLANWNILSTTNGYLSQLLATVLHLIQIERLKKFLQTFLFVSKYTCHIWKIYYNKSTH